MKSADLLLKKLVSIDSSFPHESELEDFLESFLKDLGFTVKKIKTSPKRYNLVAVLGVIDEFIGFYGHMDTVAPDKNYLRDPFLVHEDKNGRLHGLGVADMKGGIAAILKLAEFAAMNKLPVKLVFGVDEENISQGAHDLIDSEELNNLCLLISAESGQVRGSRQTYSVCYGRRGRMAIRIHVNGVKKHAAESEEAQNAIEGMARLLTAVTQMKFPDNKLFGATNFVTHSISGSTDSFSVPDACMAVISVLTTPPIQHMDVIKKLQTLTQELDINATFEPVKRKTPYSESYQVDTDDTLLRQIQTEIFEKAQVKPSYADSVADENIFSHRLKIPVISLGPIGGGDHTAEEWVDKESLYAVAETYCKILTSYHEAKRKIA